jgi:hypothetical protein
MLLGLALRITSRHGITNLVVHPVIDAASRTDEFRICDHIVVMHYPIDLWLFPAQ